MLSFKFILKQRKTTIKTPSLKALKKRVSFFSSFCFRGSMALEACLAVPIFLFFMFTLLLSLEMVRFQSDAWEALHQIGSKACFLAYEAVYGGEYISKDESLTVPGSCIRSYLGEQVLPFLCTAHGKEGVTVTENIDIEGSGNVEMEITYSIKPFLYWLPVGDIVIKDTFFGHAWVGYRDDHVSEDKALEEYVFITPTGSKYHFSQECTYLMVRVQAVKGWEIDDIRNGADGRYYPCERCRPQKEGLLYITEWGNRYHGASDCSALKRKVYIVPLSQVGDRTACSKCKSES